jgi:YD repeat-containing protein
MASSPASEQQTFVGRGLSPFKRAVTALALVAITCAVLLIAVREGFSLLFSTVAALLFIMGFIYYLYIIRPVPFTLVLNAEGIVKRDRHGETITVRWDELARVKEEFFPNGTRISVAIYRRAGQPDGSPEQERGSAQGQTVRAWVVYRDDVDDLDALAAALQSRLPPGCRWEQARVHD